MKPRTIRRISTRIALIAIACAAPFVAFDASRAANPVLGDKALSKASGEEIYQHVCQACHMADGRGAQGAGNYPALAENPRLASASFTAVTVLLGRRNMPHFAPQHDLSGLEEFAVMQLDDAQVAAVVNYVRSHFGNHYADELTAADVAVLHR
ncbi:MAG: c-type cytochrome [Rhodanobacteraceae bacterium]